MKGSLPAKVILAALVVAGLWSGFLGMLHLSGRAGPIDRVETVLLDARIALIGARAPAEMVSLVVIDDATVAEVGKGRYPLDRLQLALLIDKIRSAGARALAIDMLLVGATDEKADAALAEALGRLPVAIAGAARFDDKNAHVRNVPAPIEVLRPLPRLAKAAQIGLVNIVTDAGGTPRQVPMLFHFPQGPEPSMVLRAAGLHLGQMPGVTMTGLRLGQYELPLDLGWHLSLNYYGAGGTIRTISALDVLKDTDATAALKDRVVLLGVTATGVGDRFTTPFDQVMPGVEVLATGVSNLLDGSALIRDMSVRRIDVAAAVLITLAAMVAMAFMPLATGSVAYVALIATWLLAITLAFSHFVWASGALPIAASLPPVAGLALLRQVFDRYQLRQLTAAQAALSRFQSAALAKRIAEDADFLLEPLEQPAALLFVDLAGYTGLSERLGPRRTRDVLKDFHTIVLDEAGQRHGLIMDYMGDGVMVGFGIPDRSPRDAENAVATAFALAKAISRWTIASGIGGDIEAVRVGAHYGSVVLSRLGHENHQQIAATGDCVNVASRLLDVARSRAATVALSCDLVAAAGLESDLDANERRFRATIRGRQQPLEVMIWTATEIATDGP